MTMNEKIRMSKGYLILIFIVTIMLKTAIHQKSFILLNSIRLHANTRCTGRLRLRIPAECWWRIWDLFYLLPYQIYFHCIHGRTTAKCVMFERNMHEKANELSTRLTPL